MGQNGILFLLLAIATLHQIESDSEAELVTVKKDTEDGFGVMVTDTTVGYRVMRDIDASYCAIVKTAHDQTADVPYYKDEVKKDLTITVEEYPLEDATFLRGEAGKLCKGLPVIPGHVEEDTSASSDFGAAFRRIRRIRRRVRIIRRVRNRNN